MVTPSSTPPLAKVLLVDDDEPLRDIVKALLTRIGYEVLVAGNVDDARKLASAHASAITVLVTDIHLDRSSGRDLALDLTGAIPALRVLFMSGYVDDETLLTEDPALVAAFLAKPFSSMALARTMRELLDKPRSVPASA